MRGFRTSGKVVGREERKKEGRETQYRGGFLFLELDTGSLKSGPRAAGLTGFRQSGEKDEGKNREFRGSVTRPLLRPWRKVPIVIPDYAIFANLVKLDLRSASNSWG
ncbi:hypothetical protein KM043_014813 [Ampulex compressa]|nr:hypothetical protein KM043_014813 [Ampulex compressa]